MKATPLRRLEAIEQAAAPFRKQKPCNCEDFLKACLEVMLEFERCSGGISTREEILESTAQCTASAISKGEMAGPIPDDLLGFLGEHFDRIVKERGNECAPQPD